MVRRRTFRHALAAILGGLLVSGVAFGQLAFAPFILTTGVDEAGSFVTLADSTTFGPSGTIFDYSTRVAAPNPITPPVPGDFANSNTSLMTGGCSSDRTTQNALIELIDRDGSGDVSEDTVIWLPEDCKIQWFLTGTSNSAEYTIANAWDDLMFHCADPTVCGIEMRFDSLAQSGTEIAKWAFGVGTGMISSPTQSCDWDDTYKTEVAFGSKLVKVKASDCALSITGTDGDEWGPGDIVRITTARITGYGNVIPTWLTRVTCVSDASNNRSPASDPGGLCDEITGANQIQLEDPLPMDYRTDAYYWGGAGVGTTFTPHPNDTGPDTYSATSGHEIHQLERAGTSRCGLVSPGICGNGTSTDFIPENVWFSGIGWDVTPQYVGGTYVRFPNAFGSGIYGGRVDGHAGRTAAFVVGGASGTDRESGRIAFHSMDWRATGHNSKYFGEILSITKTNPVTVTVAVASSSGWGEPMVGISDEANSDLAGKTFLVSSGTYTSGTPNTRVMTLTGLDGTLATGIDIDTTPGGYMTNIDRYGGASYYTNPHSSNIQVVNNFFESPLQHAIMQGCQGCVYAYNYVITDGTKSVHGRGPFYHGNTGGCGNIFEGNDQDHPFILIDTSPGEATSPGGEHRVGEGCNHVYYNNRGTDTGSITWPDGATTSSEYYASSGVVLDVRQTSQNGASNERWGFLLNVGKAYAGTLDDCDNYDGDTGANCAADHDDDNQYKPHLLYDLAAHRNRCYGSGCNLDNYFEATLNPTTNTDVTSDENGDNSNTGASAVPGAWSSEIGNEPDSLFFSSVPSFWCTQSGTFGSSIGAYYDNFGGTPLKLPAQIRYEGGTCTAP